MKIGDIVQHKKTGNKMTIMRFIGDEENLSFISMDRQFETKGFTKGDPTCQWFIGTKLHTGTFAAYELEVVVLKSSVSVKFVLELFSEIQSRVLKMI